MLTRRTHILFDEDTALMLTSLAQKKRTSVGSLVRWAVRKTYKDVRLTRLEMRQKAVAELMAWQKKIGTFKNINYRTLIEDGRRF